MLTITGVFLFTCVDAFIKLLSPSFQVGQVLIVFGMGTAVLFWAMALLSGWSVFCLLYTSEQGGFMNILFIKYRLS